MTLQHTLNQNPDMEYWSSPTALQDWTFNVTNADVRQLDRQHSQDHPERYRFPRTRNDDAYVYAGRFSARFRISVAAGTFELTSPEFGFDGGMRGAVQLIYRCQAGMDLTARIVAAPGVGETDMAALVTQAAGDIAQRGNINYDWFTTATTNLTLFSAQPAVDFWRYHMIPIPPAPVGCRTLHIRIDVTDASAAIPAFFDIGRLAVLAHSPVTHGSGDDS
jgi:hypothetical protein